MIGFVCPSQKTRGIVLHTRLGVHLHRHVLQRKILDRCAPWLNLCMLAMQPGGSRHVSAPRACSGTHQRINTLHARAGCVVSLLRVTVMCISLKTLYHFCRRPTALRHGLRRIALRRAAVCTASGVKQKRTHTFVSARLSCFTHALTCVHAASRTRERQQRRHRQRRRRKNARRGRRGATAQQRGSGCSVAGVSRNVARASAANAHAAARTARRLRAQSACVQRGERGSSLRCACSHPHVVSYAVGGARRSFFSTLQRRAPAAPSTVGSG